jgi:hypothetical protein
MAIKNVTPIAAWCVVFSTIAASCCPNRAELTVIPGVTSDEARNQCCENLACSVTSSCESAFYASTSDVRCMCVESSTREKCKAWIHGGP